MRVLFVRPNKDFYGFKPIGISLLSAVCKKQGHTTKLFDTTYFDLGHISYSDSFSSVNIYKPIDWEPYGVEKIKVDLNEEVEKALKFKPDIIAFSLVTYEKDLARELAEIFKSLNLDIPIIWGGIYPTVSSDEAINLDCVDIVCRGEGIEALPELLDAMEKDKDYLNIKNFYVKKEGKIIKNEVRPLYGNLDDLPFLDWDIFDKRQFYKPFDGKVYIGGEYMLNQGCPNRCTYCINNWLNKQIGRKIRRYSPKRAIDELKYLKERHDLKFLKFNDEDFLARPMNHIREFGDLYTNEIGIPFSIMTNSRSVNQEKVNILKKMGIVNVSIGIESGNDYIRYEVLNRNESVKDISNAFKLFNDIKVQTNAFNMIGLPYENREKIFDTIELNRSVKPVLPTNVFFYPYEKTELYDLSIKEGFFKKTDETEIKDFFSPKLDLPEISKEELIGLHRCFTLYVKLPKSYTKLIERAEKNDEMGNQIFEILSQIYKEYVFDKGGYFSE